MSQKDTELLRKKELTKIQIVSSIRETFEGSSIHSLPNIIRNKFYSIKILWFVLFLISMGICAYAGYKSVMSYLSYEVVSKIEIKSLNIIDFPVVKLCNINQFSKPYAREIIKTILKNNGKNLSIFDNPKFDKITSNNSFLSQTDYLIQLNYVVYLSLVNLASLNLTEKKKIGLEVDDFLISCIFGLKPCSSNDFIDYYDFLYGNCFLFNSGNKSNLLHVSQTGRLNGMLMELFIGSSENNNIPFSFNNGFILYVYDQNEELIFNEGFSISPGYTSSIKIEKTKILKQPHPFSECTADLSTPDSYDSEYYKMQIKKQSKYIFKNCQFICYQKNLGKKCNCQDAKMIKYYDNLQECITPDTFTCNFNFFLSFLESNSFSDCDCPTKCDATLFTFSASYAEYPSMSYAKSLLNNPVILERFNKSNVTFDDLRKNLASVNIFYNDLSEQVISQDPKINMLDLFANIGGILGLFLGMSVLSFVEFIEIILQAIYIWYENNKGSKSKVNKVSKF